LLLRPMRVDFWPHGKEHHAPFAGPREDKDERTVIKEHGGEGCGLLTVARTSSEQYDQARENAKKEQRDD